MDFGLAPPLFFLLPTGVKSLGHSPIAQENYALTVAFALIEGHRARDTTYGVPLLTDAINGSIPTHVKLKTVVLLRFAVPPPPCNP